MNIRIPSLFMKRWGFLILANSIILRGARSQSKSRGIEMAKCQKILGIVLFFLLIIGIVPANSEEGMKDKLYLKSGRIVECDKAWMASEEIVRCRIGSGTALYSIDDVDLKKTFGADFEEYRAIKSKTGKEKERRPDRNISRKPSLKSGFGARASYLSYSGDELTLYGVAVEVEADTTTSFGLNYTYLFRNDSSLEFSIDYIKTDVQFEALGGSLNMGEVTQIPVLLTFRIHPGASKKIKPYLGVGLGYYLNSFDTDSANAALVYGSGAEIEVDDSFGYHFNGGLEFFIGEDYSFNLDLKYLLNKADADVNISSFTAEEMSMDAVVVGVGLKYYY